MVLKLFLGKKALGIEQVFVFMIAALTFALIMIFGYQAISGFLESGEEVEFIQFKNGLELAVKTIYTEYGSVRVKDFDLPAKFNQICFVDLDYFLEEHPDELQELCAKDLAACELVKEARLGVSEGRCATGYECVDQNVFLKPQAAVPIKVYLISIYDETEGKSKGFICPPLNKGSFSLVLEGKGYHTELSNS